MVFRGKILSSEKPLAMFDDSLLALNQEGLDAWWQPLLGRLGPKPNSG